VSAVNYAIRLNAPAPTVLTPNQKKPDVESTVRPKKVHQPSGQPPRQPPGQQ